ncbi:MAG: hypothetical protein ACLQO1_24920 [Steroidobacteraceae bacterium]
MKRQAKNLRTGQIISPPGVRPPSEDRVFVCRRVNTSGTQAAYEIFFLHQRCTPGVRPFVESGDNVFTGSVSSDVQSCLTQLDQRNVWAVGILTTENVESVQDDRAAKKQSYVAAPSTIDVKRIGFAKQEKQSLQSIVLSRRPGYIQVNGVAFLRTVFAQWEAPTECGQAHNQGSSQPY